MIRMDPGASRAGKGGVITNWAGQYGCCPVAFVAPASIDELRRTVRNARDRGQTIRAFGSGHSPSDIAMSDDVLISLSQLDRVVAIDRAARQVRVQAGATLAAVDEALRGEGLALPNLGSIAAQTVGGAVATATHGTGASHGTLSSLVEGATLVDGRGEVVRIDAGANAGWLDGVRCHLGALGLVAELTLRVTEAFDLVVEERPARFEDVLGALSDRVRREHYRFWYLPHADRVWEWSATRVPPGPSLRENRASRARTWARERLVGYHAFELALYLASHQEALVPLVNRAYARAMFSRPRSARGPSRAMFTFDCLFRQHVDEWAIPIERAAEALSRVRDLIEVRGFRAHLPIEVRFVRAETAWLSPAHARDTCYVGAIAYMPYGRAAEHSEYFEAFEDLMASFGGRPHWAKRFGPGVEALRPLYPRFSDFARARAALDPEGIFTNAYTRRVLGPVEASRTTEGRAACEPLTS